MTGPDEWAPILQQRFNNTEPSFRLRYYDTQLVSSGDAHDPRLGAWPFPPQRGPLSQAVEAFMADGVNETFPDAEQGQVDQAVQCPADT